MPVRMNDWSKENTTLLQIYSEWMDYLVSNHRKANSGNLLDEWKNLLVTYNVNVPIKLLMEFFYAKRNYRAWQTSDNYRQDAYRMCQRICEKIGLYGEDDLVNRLFSSYSAAEKRVRKKVKEGKVLSVTSKSLLDSLSSNENVKNNKSPEDKKEEHKSAKKRKSKIPDKDQLAIQFWENTQENLNSMDEETPTKIENWKETTNGPHQENKWDNAALTDDPNQDNLYEDEDGDYQYTWQKRNNK